MYDRGRVVPLALTSRLVSERALVVAAIPVYATLMVFLAKTHKLPLDGDEPHYLIMADSLVTDGDLDLKNNYERNAKSATISGPIQPHSYRQPRGWVPYHGAGLCFLVALPCALGGAWAVRVALCVFTGLLPWALFRWLAPMVDPAIASWTIAGIM